MLLIFFLWFDMPFFVTILFLPLYLKRVHKEPEGFRKKLKNNMDTNLLLYKNGNSCQKKCLFLFLVFLLPCTVFNAASSAAPQIPLCRRMLGSKTMQDCCDFGIDCQTLSNHSAKSHQKIRVHCKKKVSGFPVPSRDVTHQTLPGWE